ncbi:Os01g0854000 [Oryza sativa Japonica Group]|uniref:Os01g0854000 protein n=1 Tax=Oryza sativa subsp. japonica TaxID=39947 RepID=Q0JHM9_ORYSJ|nr:Os01g0854000 [Oryza sativa Japonica Group]|eukprot:NP_001044835.1 Os01g0854000 [Oryza sativa Japonica Group]
MALGDARAAASGARRDEHVPHGGELPAQAAPGDLPCVLRQRHPERSNHGHGGRAGVQRPAVGGGQAQREPGGVRRRRDTPRRGGVAGRSPVLPAGQPGRRGDHDGELEPVPHV